jgi:hypothetical protein
MLLAVLKDPHPSLSSLEIVGDPRLQLGDRVRVVDAEGLALDADFFITATAPAYRSRNREAPVHCLVAACAQRLRWG